jgi:protein dithiol oxidoreductase (disulfide-forming)
MRSAVTRTTALLLALSIGVMASLAYGADGYRLIPPQPTPNPSRIEVVEFFWYGCPYCNLLQPALRQWIERKPADVDIRRVPAVFRESWAPLARVFYTLESLGELDRLHYDVYRAQHTDGENLNSAERAADWAARHSIDREAWLRSYNSPEVDQRVKQAAVSTRQYSIQGTPSLVVDGRYLTSTGMNASIGDVIRVLDDLVQLAREQHAAGAR